MVLPCLHEDEVTYGDSIVMFEYIPEEGYIFRGWLGDRYETMPAHDVEYHADIETGIDSILAVLDDEAIYYDMQGRRVTTLKPGTVYIKRCANGVTFKVMLK